MPQWKNGHEDKAKKTDCNALEGMWLVVCELFALQILLSETRWLPERGRSWCGPHPAPCPLPSLQPCSPGTAAKWDGTCRLKRSAGTNAGWNVRAALWVVSSLNQWQGGAPMACCCQVRQNGDFYAPIEQAWKITWYTKEESGVLSRCRIWP